MTADTYTIEVTMAGVQDAEADRRLGQRRASRVAVGTLTIEVGGAAETVDVKAETPVDPGGERRALVHHPDRSRSRTCRSPTAASRRWRRWRRASTRHAIATRHRRRRRHNIMMDGVSTMDTGSNAVAAADERRVDRRSEGADVGLPGRVRPVERPADHGRDQERHQPVPRLGLRRRARLRLEREQPDEHPERRSRRPSRSERDWGYSIGGPIGKPGGNNKLFFFYATEFRPRTGGNDVQRFRVPTALERAGDFSQTPDNNGALYPYIKDPLCTPAPARRPTRPRLLPGRRRARQDPGRTGCTRPA